jgi:hypothetical protein
MKKKKRMHPEKKKKPTGSRYTIQEDSSTLLAGYMRKMLKSSIT